MVDLTCVTRRQIGMGECTDPDGKLRDRHGNSQPYCLAASGGIGHTGHAVCKYALQIPFAGCAPRFIRQL